MSIDKFDQDAFSVESNNIESIRKDLNKGFDSGFSSQLDSLTRIESIIGENSVKINVDDLERMDRLVSSYDEVQSMFTSDKIRSFEDARGLSLSSIENIIKDKPIEEACAISTYFLANKIAWSGIMTEESFESFKDSEARTEMINDVRATLSKTASWPEWAESIGEHAAAAYDSLGELSEDAAAFAAEIGQTVSDGAGVVAAEALEIGNDIAEGAAAAANEAIAIASEVGSEIAENTAAVATEVVAVASEVGSNIVEGAAVVATEAAGVATTIQEDPELVLQATAEMIVDSAETVCYVTQHAAVGGVRFAENCSDYIDATVNTIMGNEDAALDTLKYSVADELSARIDEYYDPSELLMSIGHAAETVGEVTTGVALTVAAIGTMPANATIMGSGLLASGVAAASVSLVGLNAAGQTLDKVVDITGEIGAREIAASTVAGAATAAATAVAGIVNSRIPHSIGQAVVEHASHNPNITSQIGGRLVGVLSSSAIAATDVGLLRGAEMASDLTNVALGLETNYDIVQELRDTAVSMAGAGLLAGVGYDVFRTLQGEGFTDYFDEVYRTEWDNYYARELVLTPRADWTPEQLEQAQSKVDALNEAAQSGDLRRTPVAGERSGTVQNRYRTENNLSPNLDADHTIDLQLGGRDSFDNMQALDRSVNRSFGRQIDSQISDLPYGAPITRVSMA